MPLIGYDLPALGAYGAKWHTQQNKHLVYLNTSGDVLVKIVVKVRAHFKYTVSGHGPTLLDLLINADFADILTTRDALTFLLSYSHSQKKCYDNVNHLHPVSLCHFLDSERNMLHCKEKVDS